ncbi:DUF5011 domain-containing protein [Flavobacteriaceae bacterium]|nr:DUF5011 domain-containing protein [Flavobacteriaceae bacterium]
MKKLIVLLLFSNYLLAQNTFDISSVSANINSQFTTVIGLNNAAEVTAFQFDLTHNESAYELSLQNESVLTSRASNHNLSVSTINNTTIRVLVYSASNEVISIGNGAVLNLNFLSKNEPGSYGISMSDIVLSDIDGQSLNVNSTDGSITIQGPRFNLITENINFGDIPMESSPTQNISVANTGNEDLIISSYSLEAPFSINQSFPVTISSGNSSSFTANIDTSSKQLVSKELTFTTNDQDALRALQTTTLSANVFAVNEIYIGSGQGDSNTEITIPVSISNMESFSGFQFDITLPSNVSYVANSHEFSSRASDHTIAASMIDNNTLRFVSYSGSNTIFSGDDGEVFSFKVIPNVNSGTYTLPISNSIISNIELGNIISEAYNGSLTINAPYLSINLQTINYGSVPITENQSSSVILTNTGAATLIIDELVYDTTALSFPLDIPSTLEPGESSTVELIFSPDQIGSFNQNISIRNNSPEEQQIITVQAEVFSPNYLRLLDKDVYRGASYDIDINLSNNDIIRGIQYDINIPDGFDFDLDTVIETSVLDDFTTSVSSLGNNNYRFLIYTVSNQYINPGDQTILKLPIFVQSDLGLGQYTFEFSNIVLSSQTNQNISSQALSIGYINVIEDTTVPVITLTGESTVTIEVGSTYTDAGATASDNYDGDITSSIVTVNPVDTAVVGVYTVTYSVTDSNGNAAVDVTRTVNVEEPLSVTDIERIKLNIFPNPTSNFWQIKSSKIIKSIDIFDITGRRIIYQKTDSMNVRIDASSLPDGFYLILINKIKSVRLIKH